MPATVQTQRLQMQVGGSYTGITGLQRVNVDMDTFQGSIEKAAAGASDAFTTVGRVATETTTKIGSGMTRLTSSVSQSSTEIRANFGRVATGVADTQRSVAGDLDAMRGEVTMLKAKISELEANAARDMASLRTNVAHETGAVNQHLGETEKRTGMLSGAFRSMVQAINPEMAALVETTQRTATEYGRSMERIRVANQQTATETAAAMRSIESSVGGAGAASGAAGAAAGAGSAGGAAGVGAGAVRRPPSRFRRGAGRLATGGLMLAAGFIGAGIYGARQAGQVDVTAQHVQSQMNISERQMAGYQTWVQTHAAELMQSQTQMLIGIGEAAKLHMGPAVTESVAEGGAKLAAIWGTDLGPTVDTVRKYIQQFHVSAKGIPALLNEFQSAAVRSGKGLDLFAGSSGKAAFAFQQAHLPFKSFADTMAWINREAPGLGPRAGGMIGQLVSRLDQGTPAMIKAAGGLRQFRSMVDLQNNGLDQTIAGVFRRIAELRRKGEGAAAAQMQQAFFGSGQAVNIARTIAGMDTRAGARFQQSGGTIDTGFGRVSKTTAAQFKMMQLSIEDISIAFGRVAIPVIKSFTSTMIPLLNTVNVFITKHPQMIDLIWKGVLAFGAISLAIKGVNLAMSATSLLTSPIGLIIVAVAAVGVGIYMLYTRWKPFHQFVDTQVFPRLRALGTWLGENLPPVFAAIGSALGKVGSWVRTNWPIISGILMGAIRPVIWYVQNIYVPAIQLIWRMAGTVITWVRQHWGTIYGLFIKPLVDTVTFVAGFVKTVATDAMQVYTAVSGVFTQYWPAIYGLLRSPFDNFISMLSDLKTWGGKVGSWISGMASAISAGAGKIRDALTHDFAVAWAHVADWFNRHKPWDWLISKFSGFFSLLNPKNWSMPSVPGFAGGAPSAAYAAASTRGGGAPGGAVFHMPAAPIVAGPLTGHKASVMIPNPIGHTDIGEPANTPMRLPGGPSTHWVLAAQNAANWNEKGGGPWGREQMWMGENFGLIEFLHQRSIGLGTIGAAYPGGTLIGTTGGVPGVDTARTSSSAAHLHVGYDARGYAAMRVATGGRGFTNAPLATSGNFYSQTGAVGGGGIVKITPSPLHAARRKKGTKPTRGTTHTPAPKTTKAYVPRSTTNAVAGLTGIETLPKPLQRWIPEIVRAAKHYHLDPLLLVQVAMVESGGFTNVGSGPLAYMGFGWGDAQQPADRRGFVAISGWGSDYNHYAGPQNQIWGAAWYLSNLMAGTAPQEGAAGSAFTRGSVTHSLAAYNAGVGGALGGGGLGYASTVSHAAPGVHDQTVGQRAAQTAAQRTAASGLRTREKSDATNIARWRTWMTHHPTPWLEGQTGVENWLGGQYRLSNLVRDRTIASARIAYNSGAISLGEYNRRVAAANQVANQANQTARYEAMHAGYKPGALGHAMGMRFLGHVAGAVAGSRSYTGFHATHYGPTPHAPAHAGLGAAAIAAGQRALHPTPHAAALPRGTGAAAVAAGRHALAGGPHDRNIDANTAATAAAVGDLAAEIRKWRSALEAEHRHPGLRPGGPRTSPRSSRADGLPESPHPVW